MHAGTPARPPSVAICDPDPQLRWVLRAALEEAGHLVRVAASVQVALASFQSADGMVLDATTPDSPGPTVAEALRERGVRIPALFLIGADDAVALPLEPGDGVLARPFAIPELREHVAALLRDAPVWDGTPEGEGSPLDGISLDASANTVVVGEQRVALTRAEFRVLAALAAHPGELVESGVLIEAGWPDGSVVYEDTLAAHVERLRRKLDEADAPLAVLTVAGFGYELV